MYLTLCAKLLQLCPTLWDAMYYSPSDPCVWHSPGKNTGVDCHALLQGIFLTQESNLNFILSLPELAGRFCTTRATWAFQLFSMAKKTCEKLEIIGKNVMWIKYEIISMNNNYAELSSIIWITEKRTWKIKYSNLDLYIIPKWKLLAS